MRVLFIDDDVDVLDEYAAISALCLLKHEAVITPDIDYVCNHEDRGYDLAFVDWKMGKRFGCEVIDAIECSRVYIVTGGPHESDVFHYAQQKRITIIPKPFHMDDIMTCIKEVVDGKTN